MPFSPNVKRGGQRFLKERKRREWTQDRAAREVLSATGVKVVAQEISRLEKGQTDTPSMESLCALAATYGMLPDEVAEEYGYTTRRGAYRPSEVQLLNLSTLPQAERDRVADYVQRIADVVVQAELERIGTSGRKFGG